ncbi:hypothetical protein ElyMa_001967100 [Elysia marginata]|uniref:Uncharacterized protein n=1 Tax=Elysia marginata TaxID=1093978 RepID=A0AAV4EZD6_9GAST|nr:hypothetical protein ElyMa_001967100 [Elysia marginata]
MEVGGWGTRKKGERGEEILLLHLAHVSTRQSVSQTGCKLSDRPVWGTYGQHTKGVFQSDNTSSGTGHAHNHASVHRSIVFVQNCSGWTE